MSCYFRFTEEEIEKQKGQRFERIKRIVMSNPGNSGNSAQETGALTSMNQLGFEEIAKHLGVTVDEAKAMNKNELQEAYVQVMQQQESERTRK